MLAGKFYEYRNLCTFWQCLPAPLARARFHAHTRYVMLMRNGKQSYYVYDTHTQQQDSRTNETERTTRNIRTCVPENICAN